MSKRADCTRRQVGAVIVDSEHRIVSTGYNGAPSGDPGCLTDGACPRGQKSYAEVPAFSSYSNCIAKHAEQNAIEYAWDELNDRFCEGEFTVYITCEPCPDCRALIDEMALDRVVWPEGEYTL